MRIVGVLIGVLALGNQAPWVPASETADLGFEARVRAQEAIERVYYSHQIGVNKPFEEVIPRALIERRVRDYLGQSVALESLWSTKITAESLGAEMNRILRDTLYPDRLREIDAALDGDPILWQECVARRSLVERLIRSFYSSDTRYHAASLEEATGIQQQLADGSLDPGLADPRRSVLTVRRGTRLRLREPAEPSELEAFPVAAEEFGRLARAASLSVPQPELIQEEDFWLVRIPIAARADEVDLAVYQVPKEPFQSWWEASRGAFDVEWIRSVADGDARFPVAAPSSGPTGSIDGTCSDDSWTSIQRPLSGNRSRHSAVWTGSKVIVWGGGWSGVLFNSGGIYDPILDEWSSMSTVNAPSPRRDHTATWTGTQMVIWGGTTSDGARTRSGGRYDPETDTWLPMSESGSASGAALAVWTGSQILMWDGDSTRARYDPVSDTWRPISTYSAPNPSVGQTIVWTGTRMIVWAGPSASGGIYDPLTDTWSAMSTLNAPSPRSHYVTLWTGSRMIVWGGLGAGNPDAGGLYDPVTNAWSPMAIGPPARSFAYGIWTGREMIVYLGREDSNAVVRGDRYDPETDRWATMSMLNSPGYRPEGTVTWTGHLMVAWGGSQPAIANDGGRYDPASESWTPMTSYKPAPRRDHTAIWTGNHMIVWGGFEPGGDLFEPTLGIWRPISTANAPRTANVASAVWTGQKLIVWGGFEPNGEPTNKGGEYDPQLDSWSPLPDLNVPVPRHEATALWTGSKMLIWGGWLPGHAPALEGGIYDPGAGSWHRMSAFGAPGTSQSTAVWTGSRMIVWGGYDAQLGASVNDGFSYDPDSDRWSTISKAGAPSPRYDHTAVFAHGRMIVWGGITAGGATSGGRYDPASDSWEPTRLAGAPTSRTRHSAVVSGNLMLIWGGSRPGYPHLWTGGRYEIGNDVWLPMTEVNGPAARSGYSMVSSGDSMIVYGGGWDDERISGSIYFPRDLSPDSDGDGVTICSGDCDDGNPSVLPNGLQVCGDQLNNDCRLASWPSLAVTNESDEDGDGFSECGGDCSDTNPDISPSAAEVCNGADDDCDNVIDEDPQVRDADVDGVGDSCDNCPLLTNPGQEDRVHPNGTGDACDDPDADGVADASDDCADLSNPGQADGDADGRGDPCDICPAIYNPAQRETLACLAVAPETSQCSSAVISLNQLVPVGDITLDSVQYVVPESLRFLINMSSCNQRDQIRFSLNGELIGIVQEPALSCACMVAPTTVVVDDEALLQRLWNPRGPNVFTLHKDGSPSPAGQYFGSYLGWVRVEIQRPDISRDLCLYDFAGGDCADPGICDVGGSTELEVTHQAAAESLALLYPFVSERFSDGVLPDRLDLGSVPDGDVRLCVQDLQGVSDCVGFTKDGQTVLSINRSCNEPPSAIAGPDTSLECTSAAGALVSLDASGSTDADSSPGTNDDIALFEWFEDYEPSSRRLLGTGERLDTTLPLGSHHLTLSTTDHQGASDHSSMVVTVVDTVAPQVGVQATPGILWPPNHRMVPATVTASAHDACDFRPDLGQAIVVSSEPDDGADDGRTSNDVQVVDSVSGTASLLLRAERSGSGQGRVYTVTFEARDQSGNTSTGVAGVLVPHDQNGKTEPILLDVGSTGMQWSPVPEARSYNVVRAPLSGLLQVGSFTLLREAVCAARGLSSTTFSGPPFQENPPAGQGFLYAVEYFDGSFSGYGTSSGVGEVVIASGDGCR